MPERIPDEHYPLGYRETPEAWVMVNRAVLGAYALVLALGATPEEVPAVVGVLGKYSVMGPFPAAQEQILQAIQIVRERADA